MSEEYLKDIFKPFTREETSLTDAVQGEQDLEWQ